MLPMLLINVTKDLKSIVGEEMKDAYIHGFKSAAEENKTNVIMKNGGLNDSKKKLNTHSVFKGDRLAVDFDQTDEDAIRVLNSGKVQTNIYSELTLSLSTKLNQEVNNAIIEGYSIPATVTEMQKVLNTETYKLTRIARTEIINVTNEGRLASYKKIERLRKKPFKYTLVVASGLRTCAAHKELDNLIPKDGLTMDDLITLQQEVASRHGFTLRGNSLLHPNQRTVLMRVA
ncbi:MAG: hypothetical protein CMM25_05225 [Rhodospirillaceae bacterium]|nr:hypothetical protein [Rhodospirillaceae bacterium]|tara:strand:- start:253 stop:945 length:693 start_codon:yes stop_codon:yes gene_type:complete